MVALVLDGLVGFPASLSPTSFHLSPSSFHLSPSSFHLFPPRLGACGRVPGSPFICLPVLFTCLPILSFVSQAGCLWSGSFVSHFFSFVSQAGCLWWGSVPGWLVSHFLSFWSGSRLACLPLPCICLPFPFMCLPLLLSPMFVTANFCPFPLAMQHFYSCPRSVTAGVRPSPFAGLSLVCPCVLAMKHFYSFVCQVRHCWCHVAFICFPGPLLLLSALFRWPCSISIHLSPRSVTAGVRPFQHFYSLVSQVCHCWCPPFFRWRCNISIHLFSRSVTASALFRWPCSISIHLFPGSVTGAAALFRWPCSISIHLSPM